MLHHDIDVEESIALTSLPHVSGYSDLTRPHPKS